MWAAHLIKRKSWNIMESTFSKTFKQVQSNSWFQISLELKWLQWIKMSSQRLFFQGGDILRLWKERCGCGSNCGFSRTKQGAAKKKRISLVLIFPFPRIFAWMSHLKTIDAYPFSDPPPLADHGNVLAWRADPQSNHWRHQCHPLIITTTKKIDFTIIVKNILKKLFPNLTINHHHQPF